ncbi:MAG: flagellar brake protein [Bdellovibrionales bacterium]
MFVKVAHKSEADSLYQAVIDQKRPLQIQLSNKKIVTAKAIERLGQDLKLNIAYIEQFRGDQDVTVSFSVGEDILFLKSHIVDKGNHYLLNIASGLHKLQRRGSFRLTVPENMDAKIKFDPIKGTEFKKPFHLSNISGGGLGVELPLAHRDLFKKEDLVEFQLELTGEFNKKVSGRIRLVADSKEDPTKKFRLGIQFEGLKKNDEEKLTQLITNLYRRFFLASRFS